MSPPVSKIPKLRSTMKRKKPHGGKEESVAVAQRIAKRRGRRITASKRKLDLKEDVNRVDAESFCASGPSANHVPGPMFSGENTTIYGGQFIQAHSVNYDTKSDGAAQAFTFLQQRVAPDAFHNSAQRVDPPRCHPATRVAVLQKIYDWIIHSADREERLLWLHGAVGAGKSALMQSTAERCAAASVAIASFFFCRSDPVRNNLARVVPTLVYQLLQAVPGTAREILAAVARHPLILEQALEVQIEQLIVLPLMRLPQEVRPLFVVFLDGLDECMNRAHQAGLVRALGNVLRGRRVPVLVLIASRREPQLETEFGRPPASALLHTITLDDVHASDDIRRFLSDKFADIKTTHIRRHLLAAQWPTPADIEEIVSKSSGQYIFAAVAMNYISSPHVHPALGLDIIKGIRVRGRAAENPFAYLDTLYRNIFAQVKDLALVLDILALNLALCVGDAGECWDIDVLESLFHLAPGEMEVLFADLTAVIRCKPRPTACPKLKFLHVSLPDFLLDKSRSQLYHINLDEYRTNLLCTFLERSPREADPRSAPQDVDVLARQESWRLNAIQGLLLQAKASDRLQHALLNFDFTFSTRAMLHQCKAACTQIVCSLQQLDFHDQGRAYRHVVGLFSAGCSQHFGLSLTPISTPSSNRAT
ncbi:hypothetical protein BJ912DRAFT_995175 [Pholiota molesta]|nr:hypothetical protein BJ912DRAFT_995175 [Pholiota molesta]